MQSSVLFPQVRLLTVGCRERGQAVLGDLHVPRSLQHDAVCVKQSPWRFSASEFDTFMFNPSFYTKLIRQLIFGLQFAGKEATQSTNLLLFFLFFSSHNSCTS